MCWLYFNDSFLSIVKDTNHPDCLLVRARVEGDIEKVFPHAQVTKGAGTDYLYRSCCIPAEQVAETIKRLVINQITYFNFKDSVGDRKRHDTYFKVWAVTREMQDSKGGQNG